MKFLVDHCAGRRLAEWLRAKGHDVFDAGEESDPGDRTLLERAAAEGRILVTLDRDLYVGGQHTQAWSGCPMCPFATASP